MRPLHSQIADEIIRPSQDHWVETVAARLATLERSSDGATPDAPVKEKTSLGPLSVLARCVLTAA